MARADVPVSGGNVPLIHHSSRGQIQRNSGDFTRGSQLLTHEILMWFAGAKLPLILWITLLFVAFAAILAVQLDEHGVQLIGTKLYAGLWDWVGGDPLKRVNLILPNNTVRSTRIAFVHDVPQVQSAWAVAVRSLMGAGLIASFTAIPFALWFIDFSKRRGRGILLERHERGAMLVDRATLRDEIMARNRALFEQEASRAFPGMRPHDVLGLSFAERKIAGIHHPYSLAGIPYPHRLEQSHTMVIGTTGSGKTTELRGLVAQMRAREDAAVIFDLTGAYVEAFFDPERDTILNPLDQRCPAWSIFSDCATQSEFTSAAAALIPADGGSSEPFWALAARTLFIEMCVKLVDRGETTNKALSDNLMTADLKRVHRFLANTIADPLTAPEAARMAESIRAVFNTNAQILRFLPDIGRPFSIRDWICGSRRGGSILFVTSSYVDLPMNRALLTLWMDIAVTRLMTMSRTRDLRIWFVFDELGALHRLPALENGLQTARAFGGAMVLGIHSFEKLVEVYGEQGAKNLSSLARSKLILATADLDTAERCAGYIGNREVRQMDEAYSYGFNNTRDASTLTPRKQVEPLVIPDDITNLPSMHGFVKFPDGFPAARIELQWRDYPSVARAFEVRVDPRPRCSQKDQAPIADDDCGGRDGTAALKPDTVKSSATSPPFVDPPESNPTKDDPRNVGSISESVSRRQDVLACAREGTRSADHSRSAEAASEDLTLAELKQDYRNGPDILDAGDIGI